MAQYTAIVKIVLEIDGDVDVNTDAVELAWQDFFDMCDEFPDSYEQPVYDGEGIEVEDNFETTMMKVIRADVDVKK